jgi:hypothetical protein
VGGGVGPGPGREQQRRPREGVVRVRRGELGVQLPPPPPRAAAPPRRRRAAAGVPLAAAAPEPRRSAGRHGVGVGGGGTRAGRGGPEARISAQSLRTLSCEGVRKRGLTEGGGRKVVRR